MILSINLKRPLPEWIVHLPQKKYYFVSRCRCLFWMISNQQSSELLLNQQKLFLNWFLSWFIFTNDNLFCPCWNAKWIQTFSSLKVALAMHGQLYNSFHFRFWLMSWTRLKIHTVTGHEKNRMYLYGMRDSFTVSRLWLFSNPFVGHSAAEDS